MSGIAISPPQTPVPAVGQGSGAPDQQVGTTLENTLNSLRQSQQPSPAAPLSQPTPAPMPPASDPSVIPSQVWPHQTPAGTRWRLQAQQGGLFLMIDLGSNRIATVGVAPQFQYLSLDAMNIRIDHVRDVIASQYYMASGNYVFTRDGNVLPDD